LAFTEDVATRFRGLGWNTVLVEDANDLDALRAALQSFQACRDRPTLIVVRSVIAWGSPNKANTHDAHGAPLGAAEIRLTKAVYGWPEDAQFLVPQEVRTHFADGIGRRGAALSSAWHDRFAAYAAAYPDLAEQLKRLWAGQLPDGWDRDIPRFEATAKGPATRASSGQVLNAVARGVPWLIGGSADLAPSNNTLLKFDGAGHFSAQDRGGRNLHFGVREHSMGAICNGMALCGIRPYCGTFFVFADYLRPAMRLSAIMHQPVLYVLTHDSIGLGEDGPTHQPVEHLAACRSIPRLLVLRPADAAEVAEAYRTVLAIHDRPAALVLTRQNVPTLDRTRYGAASGLARGAYVLSDPPAGRPAVILIGTGSEVGLCVEAGERLSREGIPIRVVSMPCWELFEEQDAAYRDSVLPSAVTARVAVEAGVRQGWDRYLGAGGRFVGMSDFGASGPYEQLYQRFGITVDNVVAAAKDCLRST
jgi:transketolase